MKEPRERTKVIAHSHVALEPISNAFEVRMSLLPKFERSYLSGDKMRWSFFRYTNEYYRFAEVFPVTELLNASWIRHFEIVTPGKRTPCGQEHYSLSPNMFEPLSNSTLGYFSLTKCCIILTMSNRKHMMG